MFAFLIFIIFVLGIIVLISLFAPQSLPWYRPHLILSSSEMITIKEPASIPKPVFVNHHVDVEDENNAALKEKVARLESILVEKNRTLEKLQKEYSAQKEHRFEFEKVQLLLEQEIAQLKTKHKKLKSQIGESNA